MKNIEFRVEGTKLVITIPDIQKDYGKSSSGKTNMVASTEGFVQVPDTGVDGLAFGLNVTRAKIS